eukprot:TRINITY_DN10520_c0_g1_i3.p1 TRINITY_DN10520_c0_g1~~TRINITY_DN10520_c0_g1_i3.p1  ORF type:complete len:536 (-),score=68.56 TRINITY_DN10520_c0_g1_i3:417-1976(-)
MGGTSSCGPWLGRMTGKTPLKDGRCLVSEPMCEESSNELVVMTLNFQYFASYPSDLVAARARLSEVLSGHQPPDIICVQEGIASRDVLRDVGFDLCVCAGRDGHAESVYNMVYGDEFTLKGCDASLHNELLCNQLYMRRGSRWEVLGRGSMQISSDLQLAGGGGRLEGKLAIRSMVWTKLCRRGTTGPCAYVMCTHITGGRFEDQYFVQQLAEERRLQPDRIIEFFNHRENPSADDVGIIVGDFNATTVYSPTGAMHGYFQAGIASSAGVRADAAEIGLEGEGQIEELFKTYMISPFTSISSHGWTFAYDRQHVGYTSGFGHCIDHMAMSRSIQVKSAKVIYLTNQKFGTKKDTDLILTDHNSVKAVFAVTSSKGHHGGTKVLRTEYDFLRCLDHYKAIVHISGFGCKQQYDDIDDVVPRVAAALCDGPGGMDTRFGKGNWVACFGGDPLCEEKPDVAYLVHRLQQQYGVHLIAIQCDKVEKDYGGVDKHIDTVQRTTTRVLSTSSVFTGPKRRPVVSR